jgi:uncharacterized membrane protein YdjX (TVP38/TMEM64 family)
MSIAVIVISVIGITFFVDVVGEDYLQEIVQSSGVYSPIIFVLLKAFIVLVAPVSGLAFLITAETLFGVVLGSIYLIIGITLGTQLSFFIGKTFGRPFALKYGGEKLLSKIDTFIEEHRSASIITIILLMGSGVYEFAAYALGFTDIPQRKFFVIQVLVTSITIPINLTLLRYFNDQPVIIIGIYTLLALSAPLVGMITKK